ncbi:hypothetical protein J7L18_04270 [Candidatus Bathyarchaeota archaeon]|nr:hypothetical protein [Candidatus Bathyarchaeota archaeon]
MYRFIYDLKRKRIILGNLPFLGISYQGREKDLKYRERFSNKSEIKRVMKVALKYNVNFFAASSREFSDLSSLHLEAVKELEEEEEADIELIVCISIPLWIGGSKVNDYKRWKTHILYESERFGESVLQKALDDPILNLRPRWKELILSVKAYPLSQLRSRLKIDWRRWESSIDYFSDWNVAWIEPGSEIDFIALARTDLIGDLIDSIRDAGYRSLLGSHHLGVTGQLIRESGIGGFDGYVTPINKLGVMMFPSKKEVERASRRIRSEGKMLIAIKPFAGGRIPPKEALTYVYRNVEADACMIGVASVEEAEEDFRIAKQIILGEAAKSSYE